MRVFAGPNGSGKSTLKSVISETLLGVYVNADEIRDTLEALGYIDLALYRVEPAANKLFSYFADSPLVRMAGIQDLAKAGVSLDGFKLSVPAVVSNAYVAAAIAAYIREELIMTGESFTFETVMSSPDKVTLMRRALDAGYRVYLYYIATADPTINISRVRNRVKGGGHGVPEDKIVSRYERSLDLLFDAIKNTSRAYVFDNSTDDQEKVWIAECTNGEELTLNMDQVPDWFARHVLDRIDHQ